MPRVSVIIPMYNCQKFIAETMESVLSQTYKDFEIIAVDDGSTDNTRQIVQSYGSKVRYIYQRNQGVSAARNNAIRESQGEYIALLDHDDLWLPDKLEKQIPLLDSNPNLGLVYSDNYIVDLAGNILGRSFAESKPYQGNVLPQLFMENFIPCLTAVIRKEAFDEAGLFSSEFSIAEEYDLFLRIAEKYEVDFINLPLANFRVHETNVSKNREQAFREEIAVVEHCLQRHSEFRDILESKIKRRKAKLYYNLAYTYFLKGEHKRAREELIRSIKISLYSPKQFVLFVFSFCSQNPLFDILRRRIRKRWLKRTIIMRR